MALPDGTTNVALTLDDLATLRVWLEEGMTQTAERNGFDDDGQPKDAMSPEVLALWALDAKLERAVQRIHRKNAARCEHTWGGSRCTLARHAAHVPHVLEVHA